LLHLNLGFSFYSKANKTDDRFYRNIFKTSVQKNTKALCYRLVIDLKMIALSDPVVFDLRNMFVFEGLNKVSE